jgi:chitin-binding protein
MSGVTVPIRTLLAAVLAALSAVPTPSPSVTAPPTERCTARIYPTLRWTGGYQGVVVLTNQGTSPMYAWYVAWELPPDTALGQVWNGIAMVSGPTVMVHAPSWHSPLAPGATISAGFLASGDPPTTDPRTLCG